MRAFLASQGPVAILDLPWMPAYLAFVFLLHPWLGALALAGTALLVALTWVTERLTRPFNAAATQAAASRMGLADANARNAEVLRAMGFAGRAARASRAPTTSTSACRRRASDIGGGLGGLSRVLRMMLQSAILGLGAYLTIRGEVSAGASSPAPSPPRARSPRSSSPSPTGRFVAARQSAARLKQTLAALPDRTAPLRCRRRAAASRSRASASPPPAASA